MPNILPHNTQMFIDLPPIVLGSGERPYEGPNEMDQTRNWYVPTSQYPSKPSGLTITWSSSKFPEDFRYPMIEQSRSSEQSWGSSGLDCEAGHSEYVSMDTHPYPQPHWAAHYTHQESYHAQYDHMQSDQCTSPGSTWSPEPSEGREYESGDSQSTQSNHECERRYRPTLMAPHDGFYQRPSQCYSPPSSIGSKQQNSCITLQEVQQHPDHCMETYNDHCDGVDEANQHPHVQRYLPHVDGSIRCPEEMSPGSCDMPTPQQYDEEALSVKEDPSTDVDIDSGSDYYPSARKHQLANSRGSRSAREGKYTRMSNKRLGKNKSKVSPRSKANGVTKASQKATSTVRSNGTSTDVKESATKCPQCSSNLQTKSALKKHISTTHTRPFTCTFRLYGCNATFGSKNEWKRHVSSQHLRLGFWRCDDPACLPTPTRRATATTGSRKGVNESGPEDVVYNDFNRKDLFTQHLRRMHSPGKTESQTVLEEFNKRIYEASGRCYQSAREPPTHSVCGYCTFEKASGATFQGPKSWDLRMEHVGRHLESGHGESKTWEEDKALKKYMADNKLIEQLANNEWRLVDLKTEDDRGKKSRKS
ncbi:MAG: hypothetical protein MMC33_001612 [Icmadophila ericetorum]|nr:hypothetical protein [Icmadophila ericetorum]